MTDRRTPTRPSIARLATLVWALGLGAAQAAPSTVAPAPVADHHMHIFSPEAAHVLTLICERVGPTKCPPEIAKTSSTGADVVAALDAAGVRRGVLLSTGYFFGSPELKAMHLDIAHETRAENQFVVGQARAHCDRLTAFISVNPLLPNAIDEIRYWAHTGGAAGLKLHLGNSGFDFRDPAQVQRLAAAFRAAEKGHLAIVMHMQTRTADYGAKDVAIFLREVASQAPTTPIQIAHAAGGGGVDKGELSALTAFADAFAKHPAAHRNIFFDLAMVPDEMSNTHKIAAAPGDVAALKAQMRRIGLGRFVLGSDWTAGLKLAPYFEDERQALALSDADWAALAAHAAPYLKSPAAACRAGR